jgi:hypothetical protein
MKTRILMLFVAVAVFSMPSFADDDGGFSTYQQLRPIDDYNDTSMGGSYEIGTYLDNPCTAVQDWTFVDYNVDLAAATMPMAGKERYLLDEGMAMYGSYAAADTDHSDVTYMAQTFTQRHYHKVSNTYDNFHVVTVINVDPVARTTSVSVETACGNGMPDSPQ